MKSSVASEPANFQRSIAVIINHKNNLFPHFDCTCAVANFKKNEIARNKRMAIIDVR